MEIYLDVFPANGAYDGPNAAQDANTTIWADTRLLYTSSYTEFSIQGPVGDCASGQSAAVGSTASLFVTVSDAYLNAPANGIGGEVSKTESPGSIEIAFATSDVERFGFDVQRRLLNAAGDGACATDGECRWATRFGAWSGGDHYVLSLKGGDDRGRELRREHRQVRRHHERGEHDLHLPALVPLAGPSGEHEGPARFGRALRVSARRLLRGLRDLLPVGEELLDADVGERVLGELLDHAERAAWRRRRRGGRTRARGSGCARSATSTWVSKS